MSTFSEALREAGMPPAPGNRFQLVTTPEFMAMIEDWRRRQPKIPSISDAIRTLAERGFAADQASPKPSTFDPAGQAAARQKASSKE